MLRVGTAVKLLLATGGAEVGGGTGGFDIVSVIATGAGLDAVTLAEGWFSLFPVTTYSTNPATAVTPRNNNKGKGPRALDGGEKVFTGRGAVLLGFFELIIVALLQPFW